MNEIFFVGLQEEYDVSVEMLLREFNSSVKVPTKREREQTTPKQAREKSAIKSDKKLIQKAIENNSFDMLLYTVGKKIIYQIVQYFHKLIICNPSIVYYI